MVRLLLLAIAIRTNGQGYAWPGYERLARETKMSVRSVRRALLEIPSDELSIRKGGSPKGQRRQPNVYQILITSNPTTMRTTRTVGDTEDEADRARYAHGAAQNHDHDPAHTDTQPCAYATPDPARSAHLTVREQTKNSGLRKATLGSAEPPASLKSLENFFASVSEKTKPRSPTRQPATPPETKEQQIERLKQKFPPHVVQTAVEAYEQHLAQNGKHWKNGRFERVVGATYDELLRAGMPSGGAE